MRFSMMFLAPILVAGCVDPTGSPESQLGRVNYAYSTAGNVGVYDPKGFIPGTIFLWDTSTNTLQEIDPLQLGSPRVSPSPRTIEVERLSNVGVEGLQIANFNLVDLDVGAKVGVRVGNSSRERYSGIKDALTAYAEREVSAGRDVDREFRTRDDNYRLVIIQTVVRAADVEFFARGAGEDSRVVGFEIKLPNASILNASVDVSNTANCSAIEGAAADSRPICFIEVVVIDPTYVAGNPLLQWDTVVNYNRFDLAQALREL